MYWFATTASPMNITINHGMALSEENYLLTQTKILHLSTIDF